MNMLSSLDETFFVGLAFVVLMLVFLKLGIVNKIVALLDQRAEDIKSQIADAEKLRIEAQLVLENYKGQSQQVEQETKDMVMRAEQEAQQFSQEATEKLNQRLQNRKQQAEDKIIFMEEKLSQDIKMLASNIAINVTQKLMSEGMTSEESSLLSQKTIDELKHTL